MKTATRAFSHLGFRRQISAFVLLSVGACASGSTPGSGPEAPQATDTAEAPGNRPELVLELGHQGQVHAVAFSPDGRLLASGSDDRTVILWDTETGRALRTLAGNLNRIKTVTFSPDGRWLASGDVDGSVRLWDVETGQELHVLWGHDGQVWGVAFSPDGRLLASAGVDDKIVVWDPLTGQQIRTAESTYGNEELIFDPDGTIRSYGSKDSSPSPDGRLVALNEFNLRARGDTTLNTIVVEEAATGRGLHRLPAPRISTVLATAISPDNHWLAAGGAMTAARGWGGFTLWDLAGGQEVHTSVQHENSVWDLAFSPDSRWLASGSLDSTVVIWEVPTGRVRHTLAGAETLPVVKFALQPGGVWLAVAVQTGRNDTEVRLWDTQAGNQAAVLTVPDNNFRDIEFTPDGRWLVDSEYRALGLYDVESRTRIGGYQGPASSYAFSDDGSLLVMRGSDPDPTVLHDLRTQHETQARTEDRDEGPIALSPDGRRLAVGSHWGLYVWEIERTPERVALLGEEHARGWLMAQRKTRLPDVRDVTFSPDGRLLAATGGSGGSRLFPEDYEIWIWDSTTGEKLRTLVWPESLVDLRFSPDGRLLAASSSDHTVKLWDPTTGELVHSLEGHSQGVRYVEFTADGCCLVTGSNDRTVRIWDPERGELLATLTALPNGQWAVVTPDGLFDGSPGAWREIRWRFGGGILDVSPVELFFNEFYRPGVLAEILAGERPEAPRDLGAVDRRQPSLELALTSGTPSDTVSERSVTLTLEVLEAPADSEQTAGSGAQDVRLFRNGSLVKVWRGDVLSGLPSTTLEATVPIVAGENVLTAYAFNHDNIKSSDATLVVTGDESLQRTGTAYILAVGINAYANSDYDLTYAVPDARVFGEELARQQAAIGTFDRVEVVSLLDQDATKANILAALSRLAGEDATGGPPELARLARAEPEDAVFVYYAGHGTAAGPRFYLIPHDLGYEGGREDLNEAAVETILSHSISDEELERAFEPIDAGHLLLVIDACNSGQALEAEEKRRGPMNSKGLAQLAYEKGMYVLAAAQGYQAALEVAELGHGLLTYALVEEGLKTSEADAAPTDGEVVMREWLDFAGVRVPQLQMGAMQEARQAGREVAFVEGEEALEELTKRSLQRPRVFYRREPESRPLVVARTGSGI